MDSDDDETVAPLIGLIGVFEPLHVYLNMAELARLSRVSAAFRKTVDSVVWWKHRAVALGCKRLKMYNRDLVFNYISKTKTRCTECGDKSARRYGLHWVCKPCGMEQSGYRQICTRKDIRRSFNLTPYKTILLCRNLRALRGGSGTSPLVYWGREVNRAFRGESVQV